jgi:phosphatidylinositol alpha-1,6-mannosyltransferase
MNKKTLIFTSEFPPLPGGIGNHAYNLAEYLQQQGYQITVITDQRHKNLELDIDFDSKHAFKVVRIKRKNPAVITYISRILKTFRQIQKHQTVIASGKFPLWIVGLLSVLFRKKQFIVVLHGSELGAGGSKGQQLTKWCLKRYDKLIAVSNFTKELALQRQAAVQIEVINNGFTPKLATSENSFYKNGLSIITVGNVTSRKGQQNVIKALPEIKKLYPEICYHIVGLPTQKNEFQKLAQELHVQDAVIFHGALSDSELHQKMTEARMFFMLSDHLSNGDVEGFGIAVLEANHLGLPAIGSKNSGIADAIKDGYSGRLVHPHNPQEIAEAFSEIMNNYEYYSKNATEWSKNFGWEKIITKYIEVIER